MRIQTVMVLVGVFFLNTLAALASSANGTEEIQDIKLVHVKPKLLKPVQPVYPYNQARAGVDGAVMIEFVIDKEGNSQNPFVVESNNPAFERPALDAVIKWKFRPGRNKEGQNVSVRAQQLIEFWSGGNTSFAWRISKGKDHASLPVVLQWDKAPVPLMTTFPVYPFSALQEKQKGKTVIGFVVGPMGKVTEAKVMEATTPEMGMAALAMIDTWRFEPAKKKDGTPGFAALSLEHEFSPSGGNVPVIYSAKNILNLLEKKPEKIIPASQLDQLPKPISRRAPIYPLVLLNKNETGRAVIEFFIDEAGDAQLPRIVSSTAPEFGYAAAQAIATWRFEPAMKDGKKVVTKVQIPIAFDQNQLTAPEPTSMNP